MCQEAILPQFRVFRIGIKSDGSRDDEPMNRLFGCYDTDVGSVTRFSRYLI